MQLLTKKQNGLKQNGGLSKGYKLVTKANIDKVINEMYGMHTMCYVTVRFKGLDFYEARLLLWKDEVEIFKKIIGVPFGYKLEQNDTSIHKCDIEVLNISKDMKDAYINLSKPEFIRYFQSVIKGF